ncbi:GntR family transcriptional regulator [Clostridiales bacterium F-3ap]|uniref:GntR family transcriptional regulator n=1 Tax=Anaerotalea alkaliphila TaxID=2662126 RepID=A0A7X5HVA2_9FIRM|nr:GntR family transcriptional regulator [Anaerotalea alkaliphila]
MQPLQSRAYEHIRDMVLTNQFRPNEIYSETKISKEIGVSRTPTRDAIQRLSQEGFIDIIPSKGFMLHQMSPKDVEDTFQVRSAIECYCTLLITKQHDTARAQALLEELEGLLGKQREVLETSHDIQAFIQHDFAFHLKIVEFAGNSVFSSIFENYTYKIKRLAGLSLSHPQRMEDTLAEHVAIHEAMKRGDVKNIYETTLFHMDTPKGINLEDVLGE